MKFLIIPLILILAIVFWWEFALVEGSYRYRMTVTVDDNGVLRTGSSVVEVWQKETIEGLGTVSTKVTGEAVFVDIGNKGTLFAVLATNPQYRVPEIFPYPDDARESFKKRIKYYENLKGKKELLFPGELPDMSELPEWKKRYYQSNRSEEDIRRGQLPMLVYFHDLTNPVTVEKVDPNNLSKVFGKGVKLDSVTMEMTKDPVTWGIEEKLPWLHKEQTLVQMMRDVKNSPLSLYHSNFKRTR